MKYRNNLRATRKASGLTLEQISEQTGYSVSMISRWESGDRRLNQDNLDRLTPVLKCSASDIVPELGLTSWEQTQLAAIRQIHENARADFEALIKHLPRKDNK